MQDAPREPGRAPGGDAVKAASGQGGLYEQTMLLAAELIGAVVDWQRGVLVAPPDECEVLLERGREARRVLRKT